MREDNKEKKESQVDSLSHSEMARYHTLKERHSVTHFIGWNNLKSQEIDPTKQQDLKNHALKLHVQELKSKQNKARRAETEPEGRGGLSNSKQVRKPPKIALFDRFNQRYYLVDPAENKLRSLKKRVMRQIDALNQIQSLDDNGFVVDFLPNKWTHHFYTLTYNYKKSPPEAGDIVAFMDRFKKHLNAKYSEKNKVHKVTDYCSIIWVKEAHKSGAIHYHFLLSTPEGIKIPKIWLDKKGLWLHGSTRYGARDGKPIKSVGYIAKYISKEVSKNTTTYKGWRAFAISEPKKILQNLKVRVNPKDHFKFKRLPLWLRIKFVIHKTKVYGKDWDHVASLPPMEISKVPGGYIINRVFYESPFMMAGYRRELIEEIEKEKPEKIDIEQILIRKYYGLEAGERLTDLLAS